MNGEGFFGPLPDQYRYVQLWDNELKDTYPGFRDMRTGEARFQDERIEPWTAIGGTESSRDRCDDGSLTRQRTQILGIVHSPCIQKPSGSRTIF